MATSGEEILNVIRAHRCKIEGADRAHEWPEFKALVARIKRHEVNCEAEHRDSAAYQAAVARCFSSNES